VPAAQGPHPAVLFLGELLEEDAATLLDAGMAVARASLPTLEADGPALLALDAAAAELAAHEDIDPERIAALGTGECSALAYLFACRAERLAAVVLRGGPILRAELSAERPVQPIEMTLNLSAAVLGMFDEADPAVPAEHVALLSEALSQGCKHFDIVSLPGPPSAAAEAAREAALAFLREWLELPG
jgi:dienelactone hydrolase